MQNYRENVIAFSTTVIQLWSNFHEMPVEILEALNNTYEIRYAIWYHLYNLKNVKNTHRGVLLLAKFQA